MSLQLNWRSEMFLNMWLSKVLFGIDPSRGSKLAKCWSRKVHSSIQEGILLFILELALFEDSYCWKPGTFARNIVWLHLHRSVFALVLFHSVCCVLQFQFLFIKVHYCNWSLMWWFYEVVIDLLYFSNVLSLAVFHIGLSSSIGKWTASPSYFLIILLTALT